MKTALPLILALSSLAHRSRGQLECNIPNDKVNASDSVTLTDPFRTPNGLFQNGSGQWTWTLATQSASNGSTNNRNGTSGTTNNDISIGQVLRLNADPIPNLLAANLSYIGCGVIIHGLSHGKRVEGQSSAGGSCDNALSAVCRETLVGIVEQRAQTHVFKAGWHKQPQDMCQALSDLGDGSPIKQCGHDLNADVWFEPFPFATPLLHQSCSFQPAACNESHVIHSWGRATHDTALVAYNNLTTLIEPIITMLMSPRPTRDEKGWAKAHLMCLRTGNHIAEGSAPAPSRVPSSGYSLKAGWFMGIGLAVAVVSAMPCL